MTDLQARICAEARRYLGVPFGHQGRNPALYIDCIGLLRLVCDGCGIPVAEHDRTDYSKDPADGVLETQLVAAFGPALPKSSLQPGDFVGIDYKGAIRHLAIVADHRDGLSLIHTNYSVGRVTEAVINFKWLRRIKTVHRWQGVA